MTPIRSDSFRDLPKVQYDLIVTNPPYVDAEDMSGSAERISLMQPELGLASGTDAPPRRIPEMRAGLSVRMMVF